MDLIARRFRGVFIAIVVLGLSAGAVFAGHVALQAPATAPTAAEQGDQDEQADENDTETPDADENETDDQDAAEAPDDTDTDSGDAADGAHGLLVSTAAKMATPTGVSAAGVGFKNHGAFVSCVARMTTVPAFADQAAMVAFLTALTPDDCSATDRTETEPTVSEAEAASAHGALVSAAAQMPTPVVQGDGAVQFRNHGEFVSCVAQMKSLPADFTGTPTDFLNALTPDACAAAAAADDAAKADKVHGKAGVHGRGRGHKRS